jgi:ubiquitin-activating enzyme E1
MEENKIDTALYSRQLITYGLDTMKKLVKMEVVVIGLRGNGVEIAKNLILAGPKAVYLFDPEITVIRDLGANFYLTENDVVDKVSRADACAPKLKELNNYVSVKILKSRTELEEIIKQGDVQVVCQSEMLMNGDVYDPH